MKNTIGALSLLVLLTGCEQAFRYPCQDPANWNAPECQRPICEVNRDCPDLIFKENPNIQLPKDTPAPPSRTAPPPPPIKGECK